MKFLHYVLTSLARKVKRARAMPSIISYYEKSIYLNEPIICLTHDAEEGYEPNLNNIIDMEKKYGVKSTFFLFEPSLPSKDWLRKNSGWDFQFHANFFHKNPRIKKDKDFIDNLIGKKTTITRSHQGILPSIESVYPLFEADSTYDNWQDITLLNPFLLKQGLIEFPSLEEIQLTNAYKSGKDCVKIFKEVVKAAKASNGMLVPITHPFLFKQYGKDIEEFLLTCDGFKFMTMEEVLVNVKKVLKKS